jgi:hypothetical protein
MRTLSRIGIAVAAALALTPAARPCDPTSYDPKDDAPRAQVCDQEAPQARADRGTAADAQPGAVPEGEAVRASLAGSGGGTGSSAQPRSERYRGYIPTDDYPHEPAAW